MKTKLTIKKAAKLLKKHTTQNKNEKIITNNSA